MTCYRLISALRTTLALGIAMAAFTPARAQQQQGSQWVVPAGFQVDVFADNVENAREMVLGSQGTLFVGSRTVGSCTRSSIATAITRLIA
jgi:hypothetical protein